jgi:hypothetical protein
MDSVEYFAMNSSQPEKRRGAGGKAGRGGNYGD